MEKIIILIFFSLIGFHLTGCATPHGKLEAEDKQAIRTLTGGIAGALITGSMGGAIVGSFVVDVVTMAKIKYEDKQLENGTEAAKRYKDRYREEDKRVGDKKEEDKRGKLFIEESFVVTQNVKTGSTVEANVQYTLLAPTDTQKVKITETRILSTEDNRTELDKREVLRTPGTYVSTVKFTMPKDMLKGYCILFTNITIGNRVKTAKALFNIM